MTEYPGYTHYNSIPRFQHLIDLTSNCHLSLSSSKSGNGVEQLIDNNLTTFWQSDGPQPHTITFQFNTLKKIEKIGFYCDFKSDESYTPNKIDILIGKQKQKVCSLELNEPMGWYLVDLNGAEIFECQISIVQNQHSGKDTHLRQIKIFGLKEKRKLPGMPEFKDIFAEQYKQLR